MYIYSLYFFIKRYTLEENIYVLFKHTKEFNWSSAEHVALNFVKAPYKKQPGLKILNLYNPAKTRRTENNIFHSILEKYSVVTLWFTVYFNLSSNHILGFIL